jgi:hypothetical protein
MISEGYSRDDLPSIEEAKEKWLRDNPYPVLDSGEG